MSILNSIIKTFVGDKAKQDLKKITPLIQKINTAQEELKKLSDDALRKKTSDFKEQIRTLRVPHQKIIEELKGKIKEFQVKIETYYGPDEVK